MRAKTAWLARDTTDVEQWLKSNGARNRNHTVIEKVADIFALQATNEHARKQAPTRASRMCSCLMTGYHCHWRTRLNQDLQTVTSRSVVPKGGVNRLSSAAKADRDVKQQSKWCLSSFNQ